MTRERSFVARALRLGLGALVLLAMMPATARALVIDLSLNVLYSNPANPTSGGTWELVAKSDGFGLVGVQALLTNIATAQNAAPRGLVNGADPAGMAIFLNTSNPLGFNEINIGQAPIAPSQIGVGEEQSVFYGIGTLTNGAPNYPGKPAGTNSIGPAFTTLNNVSGVPWANSNTFGDPAWAAAARLATGTFVAGATPGFYSDATHASHGNTFTTIGTSMNYGNISPNDIVASTIVRTNLVQSADYNHNGVVDAADYILWRHTLGSNTVLDADGNGNGVIDPGDYTVWRANFGTTPGAGTGGGPSLGSAAVPEPAAATMCLLGWALVAGRRRAGRSGR